MPGGPIEINSTPRRQLRGALVSAPMEDQIKALRRAIGQLGGAVEILCGMWTDNDIDDPEARAVVERMQGFLVEAKIALDRFDSLG